MGTGFAKKVPEAPIASITYGRGIKGEMRGRTVGAEAYRKRRPPEHWRGSPGPSFCQHSAGAGSRVRREGTIVS